MLHKIRSRAYLTGNDSVLAVADVNIDDAVIIRDCRLLKSADGNIEAQLPQIKNKDGTYTQTVQLNNYQSVLMKSLKASIFEAYTNALKGNPPVSKEKTFEMEKEQFELQRQGVKAEIRRINLPNCPALKAIADITIDNWLVVRNIRLVAAEKDGKIKPVMPQKSLPDGTRCDRVAIKDDTLLEKIRTATTQLYMRHDVPQQSAIAKADDMYMFP